MRRMALLCLAFALPLTGAVASASPVAGRPASASLFGTGLGLSQSLRLRVGHNAQTRHARGTHGRGSLSTAVFASRVGDPVLFGDETVEPNIGADQSGRAQAFAFTNTSTGSASVISVYVAWQDKAKTLIAGLYADSNGTPGHLIGFGSLTSPRSGGWDSVTTAPMSVGPGTYWLAILGGGGAVAFRDRRAGPCRSEKSFRGGLSQLPSAWRSGGTVTTCPISAYVTGTLVPRAPSDPSAGSGNGTAPADLPALLPPVNTDAPTISGSAVDGDTLTASEGTWIDSPTSYAYQWQDCTPSSLGPACTNISGASSSSYTLARTDVGDTVRVLVTAANSAGSTSADSGQTATVVLPPPPANTSAPIVTGWTVDGQALSTTNGAWSNDPKSYSYAWEDCDSSGNNCTTISNATSSSYTLAASDAGHTIRSVVTASNDGGSNAAGSAQTAVVTVPVPTNTVAPTVSGSTVQGATLTTTNGSWSGSPQSYSYAWEDCDSSGASCTAIGNAVSSSYTLTSGDVGDTIRSVVTATNSGGASSASSAATGVVSGAAPASTAPPAISGQTSEGDTLSTTNGAWNNNPTSYAYQWEDCNSSGASCANIGNATSSTYTLTTTDVSNTVRVVVTATNIYGAGQATSAAVGPVTSSSGGLSPGVSLQQIDGGSSYFADISSKSAWLDSVIPVGGWMEQPQNATQVGYDSAMGNNFYWSLGGTPGSSQNPVADYNVIRCPSNPSSSTVCAGGMHIQAPSEDANTGAETVGWQGYDEADGDFGAGSGPWNTSSGCTSGPCGYTVANFYFSGNATNVSGDTTLPYTLDGREVSQGFSQSVLIDDSNAQAAQFLGYSDFLSADTYWLTWGEQGSDVFVACQTDPSSSACDNDKGSGFTAAQSSLPANYGWNVSRLAALQALNGASKPIAVDVETGCPGSTYNNLGNCATPPQSVAAAWQGLIAGARGVLWFQHNFAGPCETDTSFVQGSNPSSGEYNCQITTSNANLCSTCSAYTLHQMVQTLTSANDEIDALDGVLLSPTANGEVSTSGDVDVMAKSYQNNTACYVFAASGQPFDPPAANQSVTFHLANDYTGTITPVNGEGQALTPVLVIDGSFTDTFADANAIHIYDIPAGC